jgi:mannosyltransferase OCH1-like enzyme
MIPKIIHQIWLSETSTIPEQMLTWSKSFKKHNPDYEYTLWGYEELKEIFNIKEIYKTYNMENEHPALKSNVLRLLLLQKFGGFYFDTDCECFSSLDDLTNCNFVTNVSGYNTHVIAYNEFFGSEPNGLMVNKCIDKMNINVSNIHIDQQWKTGYKLFNDVILCNSDKDTILLGPQVYEKYFKHYFTNTWVKKREV